MADLTQTLQNAQLWPIKAKGAVTRQNPSGIPGVETFYHAAMEQGRFLERNIADAQMQLILKKQYIYDKIAAYTRMNSIATNGQLKYRLRQFKLAADAAMIIRDIATFQADVNGVIQAVSDNIQKLLSIEASIVAEVQTALNSIANLLQQMCNWGLPPLTSLPNQFPEGLWSWNGFNFSPLSKFASLKPPTLSLAAFQNFSLSQCSLLNLGIVVGGNPSQVSTYSGLNYGTPFFNPPLDGEIPPPDQSITDPAYQQQLEQNTTVPVYDPALFLPNESLIGSLPDPATIISNFQLAPDLYKANILSLVPTTRNLVIEPSDADYANPNLNVRQPIETKALASSVNLVTVVASGYDPYLTSAWLFYLDLNRQGRGGDWLTNFESLYAVAIQPSLDSLATNAVPFNDFTGTVQRVPENIPFVDLVKSLSPALLQNLLWKLSYVEAAMLGYTRSRNWDDGADTVYLASFTGQDLDYAVTPINPGSTTVILGSATAQFPVPCTFPTSIATVMNEVISLATANIANTPGYLSPHPQYRFIYDQFAQSTMVDRYSQFWREFNNNVLVLLAQDPYFLQRVVSYAATLAGGIDPLADNQAYNSLFADSQVRNRSWTPGGNLLNLPIAPVVVFNSPTPPDQNSNGWGGVTFNTAAFLSRPDVQSLSIPTQIAMLRTNLSYAGISQFSQNALDAVNTQIVSAQDTIASIAKMGFHVTSVVDTTTISAGPGTAVAFDSVTGVNDFDLTGNVTNATSFTLQSAGAYAIMGQLVWTGTAGTYIVTITQNGVPIFQTEENSSGPFTQPFVASGAFNEGDLVQVIASTNLLGAAQVVPSSFFSMLLTTPTPSSVPVSAYIPINPDTTATRSFIADSNFPRLTAISIQSDGGVSPLGVTSLVTDPTSTPPFTLLAPYPDGIAISAGVNGQSVDVATTYGGVFPGAGWIPGSLLYVKPDGTLTQDYDGLTAGTYGQFAWLVCVGSAVTSSTFLYEPHIPVRLIDLPL